MNTPVGNVIPKFGVTPPVRRTVEIELPMASDILGDDTELYDPNEALPMTGMAPHPSPALSTADQDGSQPIATDSKAASSVDETPAAATTAPPSPDEAQPRAVETDFARPAHAPSLTPSVQSAPQPSPVQEAHTPAVKATQEAITTPAQSLTDAGEAATTDAGPSGRQAFSEDETIRLLMDLASLQEDLERAREQTNSARRHVEVVKEQLAKTTAEKTTLQEQLQRLMAEFDNYRRRVEREKAEAVERGKQAVILSILEVVDNFDRALATGQKDGGNLADFLAGVELIQRQLTDSLTSMGVVSIPAIGEIFDPMLHEAIATDETDEYKPNTVLAELKRGYKLGDRLLRPAMVRVAVRPAST